MSFEKARVFHINTCLSIGIVYELYLHVFAWLRDTAACVTVLVHANRPNQGSNGIAVSDCLRQRLQNQCGKAFSTSSTSGQNISFVPVGRADSQSHRATVDTCAVRPEITT